MDFLEQTRLLVQAWEEKSITNDIVFSLVMKNKSICRRLIQRALPEVEVGELIYPKSARILPLQVLSR